MASDERIKKTDMRLSGERWCDDCPDRDACVEEACDIVRFIARIQSKQYTNLPEGPTMSANNSSAAKPTAPKTVETDKPEVTEATVPAQKVIADSKLKATEGDNTDVTPDETDETESTVEKLKGAFKRNAKLILISAALVGAGVLLKVVKSQQAAQDELEVVEPTEV